MKHEYKELLLKDLCARLPYGVECFVHGDCDSTLTSIVNDRCYFENLDWEITEDDGYRDIDSGWVQPYLRPISSMTNEEYKEMQMVLDRGEFAVLMNKTNGLELWLESVDTDPTIWFDSLVNVQDWLNKKMFAYRTIDGYDMFELGLALEAPVGMYK